jgi:di/tricarboxylate transporter
VSVAAVSLLALVVVIVLSCFVPINIGFVSIALAFLIGRGLADLPMSAIAAGFPGSLFLTLTGVTLLFAQSSVNGTLGKLAGYSVRVAGGNRGLIPVMFFLLGLVLASIGAGNIAATALLAPIAMSIAGRAGIGGFLMTLMLANGTNAGGLSPFAPTGIIANQLMSKIGLQGMEWANYVNTLLAQTCVAFSGYLLLGGLALFRRGSAEPAPAFAESVGPLEPKQWLTLAVISSLVLSVVLLRVDVGLGAFVGAAVLSLCRAADEEATLRAIPWGVISMVCGVTVLVEVLAKTGGMALFTQLLARLSGPEWVTGAIAIVTGVISVYSSSSGVVLPAFLPTIPGLVQNLGGGNPLMIAYSINVGSHLVDVSPLSTLGALCLAVAPPQENRQLLFRKLLAWGWSMALVGGVVCQLLFGFR